MNIRSTFPILLLLCLCGELVLAKESDPAPSKPAEKSAPAKENAKQSAEKPAPEAAKTKVEKKSEPSKEKDTPETAEVEIGPLKITAEVSGMMHGRKSTPIKLDLLRWTDLPVAEVVPHGTMVKKGDVLVELDTSKIREAIEKLELAMPLKQLDLEAAQLSFEKLKKTTPIALEKARKAKMRVEEDFAYFEDVTRPMREKNAEQDVKQIKEYLAYAEEELNQLKKMYEADDLTEETEEIILRRAENSVNDYRWRLEQTEERSRRSLDTLIPREQESMERNLEETQINWRSQERSLPDALKKAELELQAKIRDMKESEDSLQEYLSDLEAMTVRAPHDGVVYYGMSQRGKWTTASTVGRKLIPGGKLTMREIFMTVADPKNQDLILSIPENKLADLKEGQSASIELVSNPEAEISGKLKTVSYVPFADNTFDGVIELSKVDPEVAIYPGMKAKAEITVYENKKALLVPSKAVKEENEKTFVLLKDGKRRHVETGRSAEGKTEIRKGLAEGDQVQVGNGAATKAAEEKPAEEKDK